MAYLHIKSLSMLLLPILRKKFGLRSACQLIPQQGFNAMPSQLDSKGFGATLFVEESTRIGSDLIGLNWFSRFWKFRTLRLDSFYQVLSVTPLQIRLERISIHDGGLMEVCEVCVCQLGLHLDLIQKASNLCIFFLGYLLFVLEREILKYRLQFEFSQDSEGN